MNSLKKEIIQELYTTSDEIDSSSNLALSQYYYKFIIFFICIIVIIQMTIYYLEYKNSENEKVCDESLIDSNSQCSCNDKSKSHASHKTHKSRRSSKKSKNKNKMSKESLKQLKMNYMNNSNKNILDELQLQYIESHNINIPSKEVDYNNLEIFTKNGEKSKFSIDNDEKDMKIEDNDIKKSLPIKFTNFDEAKKLRIKYLSAYLLARAAMWVKSPYNYIIFSTIHQFNLREISILYFIDSSINIISSPILGIFADTIGRKFISLLAPFNTFVTISLRLSGINSLAYLSQVITGILGSSIITSFESWLNYEITELFDEDEVEKEKFKKKIFSE